MKKQTIEGLKTSLFDTVMDHRDTLFGDYIMSLYLTAMVQPDHENGVAPRVEVSALDAVPGNLLSMTLGDFIRGSHDFMLNGGDVRLIEGTEPADFIKAWEQVADVLETEAKFLRESLKSTKIIKYQPYE